MLEKFLRSIRRRRRYICVKATIQLGHYFFVLRSCPSTWCIIYWKVHSQTTCNVLGYLILLTEWAQMENHIDCNIVTSGCPRISCCKIAHILRSWNGTINKQTIIFTRLFKDLMDKYISSLHCISFCHIERALALWAKGGVEVKQYKHSLAKILGWEAQQKGTMVRRLLRERTSTVVLSREVHPWIPQISGTSLDLDDKRNQHLTDIFSGEWLTRNPIA